MWVYLLEGLNVDECVGGGVGVCECVYMCWVSECGFVCGG